MFSRTILALAATLLLVSGVVYAAGGPRPRMEPGPQLATLLEDLPGAAADLPPQSPVRQAVEAGDLESARRMLSFRPLAEAPIPEGFPTFTPVGVIEVKAYPAYRKAVGPGFWPLFQHIQTESIPMTAPVEMSSAPRRGGAGGMAFLYQSTEVGSTGEQNSVVVEDTPAAEAVSLGVRGRADEAAVADARRRLEGWLADHPEYEAAGDDAFRLFGYNSPMVADAEKYWEAQIVITPRPAVSESR